MSSYLFILLLFTFVSYYYSEQSTHERIEIQGQGVGDTGVDNPATSSLSPFCFSQQETQNQEEPMEVDKNHKITVTKNLVTDLFRNCSPGKSNNKQEAACEVKHQRDSSIGADDCMYSQYQTVHCKRWVNVTSRL